MWNQLRAQLLRNVAHASKAATGRPRNSFTKGKATEGRKLTSENRGHQCARVETVPIRRCVNAASDSGYLHVQVAMRT
jgi:hypothetical protein